MAAYDYDPLRVGEGVPFDKITDSTAAISACDAVILGDNEQVRFYFQRARAKLRAAEDADKGGDKTAASKFIAGRVADLKIATDRGYIAAFNGMAYVFENGLGVEKDAEKAGNLYVEYFNRAMACCWEPSARRLLADEPGHDSKSVRRVVAEFTRWSAALGSEANGTLATQDPLPPATFTDLPPWLKD